MKFILCIFSALILSSNFAYATDYSWGEIKQKDELGQVFSLVATEAVNKKITGFDYLSMQESNKSNGLFYKFVLKSSYESKETDGDIVKPETTCDTVIVKLENKNPTIVKWSQGHCVKIL